MVVRRSTRPKPPRSTAPTKRPSSPGVVPRDLVWRWPANGRVSSTFKPADPLRKGIRIAGGEGSAIVAAERGTIDAPLLLRPNARAHQPKVVVDPAGRQAVTDYEVLERGVRDLRENRFVYTPPPPSLKRTLAQIYVSRKYWGASLAFVVVLVAAAIALYNRVVKKPKRLTQSFEANLILGIIILEGDHDEELVPAHAARDPVVVVQHTQPDPLVERGRRHPDALAAAHHKGLKLRTLTRWTQFVALSMAHLDGRHSLRDIVYNLKAQGSKLYHLGCRTVTRSSFSRVTDRQPYSLYEVLFARLYSLNASLIDLSLQIFP